MASLQIHRLTWAALLGLVAWGCSTQRSVLIEAGSKDAGHDGGKDGGIGGSGGGCPLGLAARLTVTEVSVDAGVGYAEKGYDGFPLMSRIELGTRSDGSAVVAWNREDRQSITVTPVRADGARGGDDVTIAPAEEIGGFVAHDDGFALLARKPDPGASLSNDPHENGTEAAFLLRYQGSTPSFSVALTGTTSQSPTHMYSSRLTGSLAFDGSRYGAYFAIRGGTGSSRAGYWGDQMSYVSTDGNLLDGGFNWACSENLGNRLVPVADGDYRAVCLTDDSNSPGLRWTTAGAQKHLAFEESWQGYSAGAFGSLVRLGDGTHVVVWASRGDGGVADGGTTHGRAQDAPDIAWLRLNEDGSPRGSIVWLTNTPDVAEFGVHLAPYGDNRFLLLWSAINGCQYLNGNCYGELLGTFARLVDTDGKALTIDEAIPAWPTDPAELTVYPNRDVGFAFAGERPSYASPLYLSTLPSVSTLRIARFAYCP